MNRRPSGKNSPMGQSRLKNCENKKKVGPNAFNATTPMFSQIGKPMPKNISVPARAIAA